MQTEGNILRELDYLTEFIIGRHKLNNIRYTNDTVEEGKLKELLDKLVKENKKKRLLPERRQNAWLLLKMITQNSELCTKDIKNQAGIEI